MTTKKGSGDWNETKGCTVLANATKGSSGTGRCRVLAYQPLSVNMASQVLDGLSIQKTPCSISIRSVHESESTKLLSGGSLLGIEFEAGTDEDLLVMARRGLSLLEDFLSAISLVSGSPFQASEPLQVAQLGKQEADECEFLMFMRLPLKHWQPAITNQTVAQAKHLLAHWDGLESGHRLRRAALQYREAIGNLDDTAAFQEAYIGLESMEPPLAKAAALTPGTEEVRGKCESCGHEFTRKRSALVGLRAFVLADLDPGNAEKERKADWKLIHDLRNDLMHGLVDLDKLGSRSHRALLAAMHHLQSAIFYMSHATELVTAQYKLARGGPMYLAAGAYRVDSWPSLDEWGEILESTEFSWVPHETYGFVPQIAFRNAGLKDLEVGFAVLGEPFSFATMNSITSTRYERN